MKRRLAFAVGVGLASLALGIAGRETLAAESLSTQRHVHGVITAVDPAQITIATATSRAVTGKIDPARTKVTLRGRPAKLADLQVTAHAKAELCLDDVWLAIDAH